MDPARTASRLAALVQFEIDVVKAYEQATHHVSEPVLVEELHRTKADHERHVLEMSEIMRALGAEPPAYARDLKGYLMACLTAMRSAKGSEGALRAVRAIAAAARERYAQASEWDVPIEIRAMFQSNEADVIRHIDVLAGESAHAQ